MTPALVERRTGPGDSLVRSLSLAIFLQWLGASAILPLLPLYLRDKGGSDNLVGAVMAAYFSSAETCFAATFTTFTCSGSTA